MYLEELEQVHMKLSVQVHNSDIVYLKGSGKIQVWQTYPVQFMV